MRKPEKKNGKEIDSMLGNGHKSCEMNFILVDAQFFFHFVNKKKNDLNFFGFSLDSQNVNFDTRIFVWPNEKEKYSGDIEMWGGSQQISFQPLESSALI